MRNDLESKTVEELFVMLKNLDLLRAKTIEKGNKRRLIRALEIVMQDSEVKPLLKKPINANVVILGIKKDREEIRELI